MTGLPFIFDIRRGSADDGPGLRTTVFFKGCPLACVWCHNPEAISPLPEVMYHAERCLGERECGACAASCPRAGALPRAAAPPPGCTGCGRCADNCPVRARELQGRQYPLDELCALLLRDEPFYRASGGGVTLSGGEPTLGHGYIAALLSRLKERGVHTAIQTCGAFETGPFLREILPLLDLVYFDLKLGDPQLHRLHTGGDNRGILSNLALVAERAPERLTVRTPLVPGITATEENLQSLAGIVKGLGIARWELLPYNPGGLAKLKTLGRPAPTGLPESFMLQEEEEAWRKLCQEVLRSGS